MSQNLVPGQNCAVPADTLSVAVRAGAAADFSAFRLFAGGKTRKDADFVFYGQKTNDDGTVELSQESAAAMFRVALPRLAPDVEKIVLAVTSDYPSLASLGFLELDILQGSASLARCRWKRPPATRPRSFWGNFIAATGNGSSALWRRASGADCAR